MSDLTFNFNLTEHDTKIMRDLAARYFEAAYSDINNERWELHRAVNDLNMIRPVVLLNEIPWSELIDHPELQCQVQNEDLKGAEYYFRTKLFQWKYFPGDMVLEPYFPVWKRVNIGSIGIEVEEDTIATDENNGIVSHEYHDMLATDEAVDALHAPEVTYDEEATNREFFLLGEVFGDILPVKKVGQNRTYTMWDDISRYRGVTDLLMDLVMRPEFTHKLMRKMTDIQISIRDQFVEKNLFNPFATDLHCTCHKVSDLPSKDFDPAHVTAADCWGRSTAQIFASVSPEMHEEFEIEYMKEVMEPFGLVYYGCCEPLHDKIDIVEKLPHLRKISITPWADVDVAAEKIGKKYVLANKPQPSNLSTPHLDKQVIKDELSHVLAACKRNSCSVDIVLKDISSIGRNLQNLIDWEQTAMELVKSY